MRIIFYLILVFMFFTFSSCSKGDPVQEPLLGNIYMQNFLPEDIGITGAENVRSVKSKDFLQFILPSGKNRFRFYLNDTLSLDTLLQVNAYEESHYTLFRKSPLADLTVLDASFNGLDKELIPDSGFIKLCIANFSSSLPNNINLDIYTNTYTPVSLKPIQVAENVKISSSFSDFETVRVGISQASNPVNLYTLVAKDPSTNSILASIPFTIPFGTSAGTINKLDGSVFLLFINENNTPTILMRK